MTKVEVTHFLAKIKAYYQNFIMEDYVVDEWADKLKKYDMEDVYKKFDEHLNGDYKSEIPKLHYIIKYLKTKDEKQKVEYYFVKCGVCNKTIHNARYDEHISRHNSVSYIKSREKLLKVKFNEEKLYEMSNQDFNKFYDKFIEELYNVTTEKYEKQRLKNIILSKAGMPVEYTLQELLPEMDNSKIYNQRRADSYE